MKNQLSAVESELVPKAGLLAIASEEGDGGGKNKKGKKNKGVFY